MLSRKLAGATGALGGMFGRLLGGAVGLAAPFVGPLVGAAIGKIFGRFKKPSEAELAAREQADDYISTMRGELGEAGQAEVARLVAGGWDESLASVRVRMGELGAAAGVSNDEIHALYADWQTAIKDGDTAALAAIERQVEGWRKVADEAGTSAEAQKAAMEESARAAEQRMNEIYSAAVGAYEGARRAGEDAYKRVYEEAIKAGEGEEAAIAKASAARDKARAETLAAEGDKFARLVAFEDAATAAMNAKATESADHSTAESDRAAKAAKAAAGEQERALAAALDKMGLDYEAFTAAWVDANAATKDDLLAALAAMKDGPGGLSEFREWVAANPSKHTVDLDDTAVRAWQPPANSYSTHTVRVSESEGRSDEADHMAAGGFGVVGSKPRLFLAHPGESYWFSGTRGQVPFPVTQSAAGGSERPIVVHVHTHLDGEEIAENNIRVDPRVRDRLGLT